MNINLNIYAIEDKAIDGFQIPFFQSNDTMATRTFAEMVNNPAPENLMRKYPGHFTIWCIGTFDTKTGMISTEDKPRILTGASNVLKS